MNNDFIFYTLNGTKTTFSNYEYLKEGKCAKIYKKDDIILKIYKSSCKYKYYISKNIFKTLKQLHIPNIVKLINFYYYNDYPKVNKLVSPDSYTMKYIKEDKINLLYINKDYLLETLYSLEKTIDELSKNKIRMFDVHNSNIIFNNDGATIIDVDNFKIDKLKSSKKLLLLNKKELLYYIKSKIQHDYLNIENNNFLFQIDSMFNNIDINNSLTDELNKKLTKDTIYNTFIND